MLKCDHANSKHCPNSNCQHRLPHEERKAGTHHHCTELDTCISNIDGVRIVVRCVDGKISHQGNIDILMDKVKIRTKIKHEP